MTTLSIENVTLTFGGLNALSNVNMTIEPGLITSIIGPNGAGKTSILNCISGFYHPSTGEIRYGGKRLTHAPPHQVTKLGIARAFQNLELFSGLTVLDNLMLARHHQPEIQFFPGHGFFVGKASGSRQKNRQSRGRGHRFHGAGTLPQTHGGNLATVFKNVLRWPGRLPWRPKLLLLDEPMAGMNIEEKEDMVRFIIDIQRRSGMPPSFWWNTIWAWSWTSRTASMCWISVS
jgi:branched-chain amino acid transport system ATP-binding protein